MDIPEDLFCLFNAEIEEQDGSYVIEVPEQEIDLGAVQPGEPYRVALLSSTTEPETTPQPDRGGEHERSEPPVEEGETVEVEIEDTGEQGDGIARIDQGYIVFVPETEVGDRVTVEISDVRQNFAFGEIVEGPY